MCPLGVPLRFKRQESLPRTLSFGPALLVPEQLRQDRIVEQLAARIGVNPTFVSPAAI
jgi:hypothetical protein